MYPPLEAHNVWQREQIIRRQFESNMTTHCPEVYALPRDHTLAQQTHLEPCEDIVFLNDKFKRDVCALLGIPFELISGRDSAKSATGGAESVRKTMASGRLFSTNMQDFCKHLQRLLIQVYRRIYASDKSNVSFALVPMPRLEVECIADLQVLHEIGALTPDMSLQLSKTLLGESGAKKQQNKAVQNAFGARGDDDKNDKDESQSKREKDIMHSDKDAKDGLNKDK